MGKSTHIMKQCDTCEHRNVCGYKEDVLMAIDTIRDNVRRDPAIISVKITCTEYREEPTRRML